MVEKARASLPMTFEDAALLDPDERAGELEEGVWVPVTRGTWRHSEIVLNIGTLLKLYSRHNPG